MAEPLARALLARLDAPLAARLRTARELVAARPAPEPAAWSLAVPELAALLPGGLPRGALTELAGRRSSGRLGLAVALLAAATGAGENAALVDLGETLAAAEAVVGGGFPLVVVELGLPPVPGGRGAEAQWLRLAHAARAAGGVLLVSAPARRCGVAAAAALALEAARPRWRGAAPGGPLLLDGITHRLTLAHAKRVGAFQQGGLRAGEPQAVAG